MDSKNKKEKHVLQLQNQIREWIAQDVNPYESIEEVFTARHDFSKSVDDFFTMIEPLVEENNPEAYYYLSACYSTFIDANTEENQNLFWKQFTHLFHKYLHSEQLEYFLVMNIFCYHYGTPIWKKMLEYAPDENTLARINTLYEHEYCQ